MTLKESFRYQNFLDRVISNISVFLSSSSQVTTVTQFNSKKSVFSEAEDEELDISRKRTYNCKPQDAVSLLMSLLEAKEVLCNAISTAKLNSEVDIDNIVSLNKKRQEVAGVFLDMSNMQSSEIISEGRGFKFNADGNQVAYVYPTKQVTKIDFDRNVVKALYKKLKTQSDKNSEVLDRMLIDIVVDYEPMYDINDSVQDIIDKSIQ